MRIKIFRILIIILFLIILGALVYIQAIRGRYFYNLSTNNRIRIVPQEGWRGRIKDRNGVILADNRISYNVVVTPQAIKDGEALFGFLSEALGEEKKSIMRRFHKRKFTPFAPVTIAEDVSRKKAVVIEENKFRFPSLIVQESYKRFYPKRKNSAHVLGYVGKINRAKIERFKEYGYSPQTVVGYTGIEEYYDAYLMGKSGGYQIEVNSRGEQVRLLSLKDPVKGADVQISIDSRLQDIAMNVIEGQNGAIVMIDLDTGQILGMTSSPSYDPNIFVDPNYKSNTGVRRGKAPFLNRAIKGRYPPGSVFKVPVALAALESKKVTQYTPFDCEGFLEFGGIRFGCVHVHGSQDMTEAMFHSCNIYFYQLGLILKNEMISRYAKMLGLGELTGIDLPYEKKGLIPSRNQRARLGKRWYGGDTINLSIGQGDVLTTPLQLAQMMATVANDGVEVQPHLIMSVDGKKVNTSSFKRQVKIKKESFKIMQDALRKTVTRASATAHATDIAQLYVAGKTGTAQTSGDLETHAWFAGYAKGDVRQVAFCVFLEHGGSSQNAVLLTRQLLLRLQAQKLL